MARTSVHNHVLIVEFSAWERLFTQRRRIVVPLTAARQVKAEPDALAAIRGMRIAGVEVFGVLKAGYWGLGTNARQLVCVRRGHPAVRITLAPGFAPRFDEILVSAPTAASQTLVAVRT